MQVVLTVSDGPMAGRKCWVATGDSFRVGRTAAADFIFDRDGEMSSLHFEVSWHAGRVTLRDLGSTNGTYVDERRVDETELQDGACIRAGRTHFDVSITSAPQQPADDDAPHQRTNIPSSIDDRAAPSQQPAHHVDSVAQNAYRVTLRAPSGQVYEATIQPGQSLTLGRSNEADVCVAEDGMMSGMHLQLQWEQQGLEFADLDSTNGVFLNTERVRSGVLHPDDQIQIGQSQLTVCDTSGQGGAPWSEEAAASGDSVSRHAPQVPAPPSGTDADMDREASAPSDVNHAELRDQVEAMGGCDSEMVTGASGISDIPRPVQDGDSLDQAADIPSASTPQPVGDQPDLLGSEANQRLASDAEGDAAKHHEASPVPRTTDQPIEEADRDSQAPMAPGESVPAGQSPEGGEIEIVIVDVEFGGQTLRKFWLTPGQTILVGSGAESDEVIPDEHLAASQWAFQADSSQCVLTHLPSQPPTFVNEQCFQESGTRCSISNGDHVRSSDTSLSVSVIPKT